MIFISCVLAQNTHLMPNFQENLLIGLSEKMNVSKSYTYSRIAEIAYQNSNLSYCQQICFKAIALGLSQITVILDEISREMTQYDI